MGRTTWERNTAGLAAAARERVERAFERAERAIELLRRENARVNFNTVARRAGVTRGYLYTRPELRSRIERLR